LYSDLADYQKSESYYLKCLVIREQILSPEHPAMIMLLKNMEILEERKNS